MPSSIVESRPFLLLHLRQLEPDLALVAEQGSRVKVHSSLIALLSPIVAKLLANNPGSECITLPVSPPALLAFHALYLLGSSEQLSAEEVEFAKDVGELLEVEPPVDLEKDKIPESKDVPELVAFSKIIVTLDARKMKTKSEIKDEIGNPLPDVNHLQETKVKLPNVKGHRIGKRSYQKKGPSGPFVCEKCPKIYESRGAFDKHKISHLEKVVPCNHCNTKFRTNSLMQWHKKRKHSQGRICTKCGDIFKYLEKHMKGSMCGLGEKPLAIHLCSMCPKKFTSICGLRYHGKNIHKKIKNYTCHSCEYKTYSRSNLAMHVGSQHEGRKLEKQDCPFCKKKPYSLDTHIVRYHGIVAQ